MCVYEFLVLKITKKNRKKSKSTNQFYNKFNYNGFSYITCRSFSHFNIIFLCIYGIEIQFLYLPIIYNYIFIYSLIIYSLCIQ